LSFIFLDRFCTPAEVPATLQKKTRESSARTELPTLNQLRRFFSALSRGVPVSSHLPLLPYCFAGGGGGAPTFDFRGFLCFRGAGEAPAETNETFCGSPGTLVSVKLSPTFLARSDI